MSYDMGSSGTVSADNKHKFYPSPSSSPHHQYQHHHLFFNKKTGLRDIDIPPRKLLLNRRNSAAAAAASVDHHMFLMDSPKGGGGDHHEGLLQKFFPCNNINDDDDEDGDDVDPYSSDHFRMYEFKVRKCTRSRSHDWTDCPFAHPGEKARRRDPRRYHYTGTVCAEFRRGNCSRGDNCEFAHGVFECWLHPSRYRTEACKDGKNCKRKVCFFAHTPRQLRVLPASCHENVNAAVTSASSSPVSLEKNIINKHRNHCCVYCTAIAAAAAGGSASSPTSTLIGMSHLSSPPMSPSHSLSPPLSPAKSASVGMFSPYSKADRHSHNHFGFIPQFNSYKDALTELMSSLEAMQVNESPSSSAAVNRGNLRWLDVNFMNADDQQQFMLSPSTPTPPSSKLSFHLPEGNNNISTKNYFEENKHNVVDSGFGAPDLGWVNDLLT